MFSYGTKEKWVVVIRFSKFKIAANIIIMKQYSDQRDCYEPEASAMLIITHKSVYTSKLVYMQILNTNTGTQIFREEKI